MLIGACWPYLDQEPAPRETWELAEALGPAVVRICSNAAVSDVEELHRRWPGLRWVVRAKLPKVDAWGGRFASGDFRPDLLDYREWPSEPSLRECLERLLGRGCAVDLELLNEPDLEWDEAASWGPIGAWLVAAADCRCYLERQVALIRTAFEGRAGLRLVGPALSQGWPERHEVWLRALEPLLRQCDALAVHAYTSGRPFDDPDWGGRPLEYARRFAGRPLLLTETNGNGADDDLGAYLRWLEQACPSVELACLFALPGQPNVPEWWSLTGAVVERVRAAIESKVQGPTSRGGHGTLNIGPGTSNTEKVMPKFVLGFKALADALGGGVVGEPLEDERELDPTDLRVQWTTRGVLIYSKRLNKAHFLAAR